MYAFEFMRLLAICHTIQAEERNGNLVLKRFTVSRIIASYESRMNVHFLHARVYDFVYYSPERIRNLQA